MNKKFFLKILQGYAPSYLENNTLGKKSIRSAEKKKLTDNMYIYEEQ
jgi:hypothetical protein